MTVFGVLGGLTAVAMAVAGAIQEPWMSLAMFGLIVVAPCALSMLFAYLGGWFPGLVAGVVAAVAGIWISVEVASSIMNTQGPSIVLIVEALVMICVTIWWLASELPLRFSRG